MNSLNNTNTTPLDSVSCDVTNCVYNKESEQCTAKHIKVGPQYAACGSDTVCSTFKPQ